MDPTIENLLPKNFNSYPVEVKASIIEYLKQLSVIEQKACNIAMNHLGSSFNIIKSNGYNDWIKSKK